MGGRVAVLGLGNMGVALARTLLGTGHQVRVWNRTTAKAEALREDGALPADTVAGAIADTELVVVCLAEHRMTMPVLQELDLVGRCVIQLTGGTPDETAALDAWLRARDATLVEGQILVYPSAIGTKDSRIVYAGPAAAIAKARSLMDAFGGAVLLGEQVGAVSMLGTCARVAYQVGSVGAVLAAEIARVQGVSVEAALVEVDRVFDLAVAGVRRSFADTGPVRSDEVEVTIERMAESTAALTEIVAGLGLDNALLRTTSSILERAREADCDGDPVGFVAPTLRRSVP